jgi:hypothetical protein
MKTYKKKYYKKKRTLKKRGGSGSGSGAAAAHSGERFKCPLCDKTYAAMSCIYTHAEKHHPGQPMPRLTYATTVHFDVEIEYERILREDDIPTQLDEKGYALFDAGDDGRSEEDNGKLLKKDYTPSEFAEIRKNTTNNLKGNVQMVKMLLEKIYFGKMKVSFYY